MEENLPNDNPINEVPPQQITPAPQVIQNPYNENKSGSKKVLILAGGLVAIIVAIAVGAYLIGVSKSKGVSGSAVISPTPVKTTTVTESNAKALTEYTYIAEDGSLMLGDLKTFQEKVLVVGKKGTFAGINNPLVSPDGKYVSYLRLNDKDAAALEASHPIEFHGSDDWEMHLVDISNPDKPVDSIAETKVFYGLGNQYPLWSNDSKKIYFTNYSTQDDYYSYNLNIKTLTKIKDPDLNGVAFSPSGKISAKVVASKTLAPTSTSVLNQNSAIEIRDADGVLMKTVRDSFMSAESSLVFASEDKIFLAREVFIDGPKSVCYIESIDLNTSKVQEIEKKDCPPGSSFTNYNNLKMSPDGKILSALYSEDGVGNPDGTPAKYTGSIFIYNLETGEKKMIAAKDLFYGNQYWVSPNEIIATVADGYVYSGTPQTFRINVKNGMVTKDSGLSGKNIIAIF